jgi:hypothetical protein
MRVKLVGKLEKKQIVWKESYRMMRQKVLRGTEEILLERKWEMS